VYSAHLPNWQEGRGGEKGLSLDGQQDDFESRLETLWAKQEIHEALMRYCRGIDRGDESLVLSAFHEDAWDNHFGEEELAFERFPKSVALAKSTTKWTSHNICNELIEVHGDVAHGESYLIAYHRIEHEGRDLDWILGARYVDRFEKRNGSWRIAHRTVVFDWQRFEDVNDPPAGISQVRSFDRAQRGLRSLADFSYRHLHL
jgi:SnoaL-like domain